MEKRMEKESTNFSIVVITGPESTGKTVLAKALSKRYNCRYEPELSRKYISDLNREYTYNDVEQIAKMQIHQFEKAIKSDSQTFFDTGLIISKVWFDVVYEKCPIWLIEAIEKLPKFNHLLCDVDLPWIPDSVRENGGEMRNVLLQRYKEELKQFGFKYRVVSGIGSVRFKNAIELLKTF